MIASTDLYEDRINQQRFMNNPHWCRLCHSTDSQESRKHLLTDCPATVHLVEAFSTQLKDISNSKFSEFCSLSTERRWLWILGGGTINNRRLSKVDYRLKHFTSPFAYGASVRHKIDKEDPKQCLDAYFEFKEIEHSIKESSLVIFTDGSFKENLAGSGAVVYFQNKILHKISSSLGNQTISYAELFSIYSFLCWLRNDYLMPVSWPSNIRIFLLIACIINLRSAMTLSRRRISH